MLSCTNSKQAVEFIVSKNSFSSYISQLETCFPVQCIDSSAIYIWRIGSIEWASSASVLVLKENVGKHNFYSPASMNYLVLNKDEIDTPSSFATPLLVCYNLPFGNEVFEFDLSVLKLQKIDYLLNNKGEGHCANQYFIKKFNDDRMLLVNGDASLERVVAGLFSQVSPQEHFQSLSLNVDCQHLDSIADNLFFKGKIDSLASNYFLPYSPPIRFDR